MRYMDLEETLISSDSLSKINYLDIIIIYKTKIPIAKIFIQGVCYGYVKKNPIFYKYLVAHYGQLGKPFFLPWPSLVSSIKTLGIICFTFQL